MNLSNEVLEQVSGLLMIVGFAPYIYAVLFKGKRPNRVTWTGWLLSDGLLAYGLHEKGQLNDQLFWAVVGVGIVCVLSIVKGKKEQLSKSDIILGIGVAIGVVFQLILPEGTVHIYVVATTMMLSGFATWIDTWRDPRDEDPIGWLFWAASCVPMLMALGPVSTWAVVDSVFPYIHLRVEIIQPLAFAIVDIPFLFLLLGLLVAVKYGWKTVPVRPEDALTNPEELAI